MEITPGVCIMWLEERSRHELWCAQSFRGGKDKNNPAKEIENEWPVR